MFEHLTNGLHIIRLDTPADTPADALAQVQRGAYRVTDSLPHSHRIAAAPAWRPCLPSGHIA